MLRGVTLVELLVAIAVLIALAAILLPVTHIVRSKSILSACADNLSQIGKAAIMYADDNNDWLPPYFTTRSPGPPPRKEWGFKVPAQPKEWRDSLARYTRSKEVFWCPADPYRGRSVALVDDECNQGVLPQLYTSYRTNIFTMTYCVTVNGIYRPRIRPPGGGTWQVEGARVHYVSDARVDVRPLSPGYGYFTSFHGTRFNWLYFDGSVGWWDSLSNVQR